ncbi:MFS transporter [Mycolicibacterium chitae]|uniref:Arabinose efflux permease family protein n=1 Tax=Mycolicibacterium chitae TaxID=1792 RepID=A0A3S4RLE3_MYCCI|nr:MFS transporter [Mycolicibacterium chitae]MCV7107876.1 YbfB/YjiJ family MFS transporter [Mycolicibacterium chitae]BBZ01987.1 MFS transporter [Mycolicibacterium chitae]VEG50811.1 arabinose efflux permease family protein [Mycolicibacterium chitae]
MQRSFYSLIASGCALIACCYGFARFGYGLFAPVLADEFGLSSTTVGVIAAGGYVGYCAAISLSAMLTTRLGPRAVAVGAGVVATLGMTMIALSPTAGVLAVGVLVAGTSTGIASPPLAAAISQRILGAAGDRAQTIVNAGTGIGVLASGPIAFVFFDHWRFAWGWYAVIAAATTTWVFFTVGGTVTSTVRTAPARRWRTGSTGLVTASLLTGIGSITVWSFGRGVIGTAGPAGDAVASIAWTVLGAAGIAGALGGDLTGRVGPRRAWMGTTLAMSAATIGLALAPSNTVVIMMSASVFGAAYIGLTGLLLLWSTRVYPDSTSLGVGLSFFMIAFGQAMGAALAGSSIDAFGATTTFVLFAMAGATAAAVRPAAPAGNCPMAPTARGRQHLRKDPYIPSRRTGPS